MDALELMKKRHSVRSYTPSPLSAQDAAAVRTLLADLSDESGLRFELITDSGKAFSGLLGRYGKFSNASSCILVAGAKGGDNQEKAGYYGEKAVLAATGLGLGTCWVAGTYDKKRIPLLKGEELVCVITIGYAATPGRPHRSKTREEVAIAPEPAPDWFVRGVEAALLAPTAINQQKFVLELDGATVRARTSGFGFYTKLDLGIVKLHFELGAGKENFSWAQ